MNFPFPNTPRRLLLWIVGAAMLAAAVVWAMSGPKPATEQSADSGPRPALTVSLVAPQTTDWQRELTVNGNIAA